MAFTVFTTAICFKYHRFGADWGFGGENVPLSSFLNASDVGDRYNSTIRNLASDDQNTSKAAVRELQKLIAPLVAPDAYQVASGANGTIFVPDSNAGTLDGTSIEPLIDFISQDVKETLALSAFTLGVLFATGVSPAVDISDAKATALYKLAAKHGSPAAHLALAYRHEQGFNVPKSCSIAYNHLKIVAWDLSREADKGRAYPHKPRQVLLRERQRTASYLSDAEALFSYDQLSLEQQLADMGHLGAMQFVAYRHLVGLGMEPNVNEAVRLFEDAAARGDPEAMLNLGLLHIQGIDGKQNFTRAHELFVAASKGIPVLPGSYNALGHLYFNGLGVEKNTTLARELFAEAARLKDPDGLYHLALMYMYGLSDLPVNATRAHTLLLEAYHVQQAKAPLQLSELYAEFDDIPGGQNCSMAIGYLWEFVEKHGTWSEESMDALEMATGKKQPGGVSDVASGRHGLHQGAQSPLPHSPANAVLIYTLLAEQGNVAASMNAAWLLEHITRGQHNSRAEYLVSYLYARAALKDWPSAIVDYANWLLRDIKWAGWLGIRPSQASNTGSDSPFLYRQGAPVVEDRNDWEIFVRSAMYAGKVQAESVVIQQARALYLRARSLGDPEAATNLAWMHAAGIGTPHNLTAAVADCKNALMIARTGAEKVAPYVALAFLRVWIFAEEVVPTPVLQAVGRAAAETVSLSQVLARRVYDVWDMGIQSLWQMWLQT